MQNDKSKIIYFLLGLLQAILLGWLWWVGAGVVEAKEKIATLETSYTYIQRSMDEIKSDVKQLLERQ